MKKTCCIHRIPKKSLNNNIFATCYMYSKETTSRPWVRTRQTPWKAFFYQSAVAKIKWRGNILQNAAIFATLLNNKDITIGPSLPTKYTTFTCKDVKTFQCVSYPVLKSFIQKFVTENVLCNTVFVTKYGHMQNYRMYEKQSMLHK